MSRCLPAVIAVLFGGCTTFVGYGGTGSLQRSGVNSPELASQQVVFMTCQGASPSAMSEAEEHTRADGEQVFSALGIGDGCWIDGRGMGASFVPTAGRLCRLHFPEGDRQLRVTDFSAQYGQTSYLTGRAYIDENYIEFALGGDDPETGRHALYRFAGRALQAPDTTSRCDDLRREREREAGHGSARIGREATGERPHSSFNR